jgi:DNA helicase HerA-like ATPase
MAVKTIWDQKRIGVIRKVTTSTAIVAIDSHLSTLSLQLNGKVYPIGQIGSYVLIPVGRQVLLGMVSEFRKFEYGENGKTTSHYEMTISLVGSVKNGIFERGVSTFPTAEAPVYLLEEKDLAIAFSVFQKFGFSVGRLSLFENERAYLNPNSFFGKHIAVIGASGSGKSCSVASILQKVVNFPDTKVVILDMHNEYQNAFPKNSQYLNLTELELPFWLMTFQEMMEVFVDLADEHAATHITVLRELVFQAKRLQNPELKNVLTIDTPVYYDFAKVRSKIESLETEKNGPFCGKFARFLVQLDTKLNDPRYDFMFKPRLYIHSESFEELLTKMFGPNGKSKVTIMDMSGVPFDIVNTVVSLMARLAFDFNFWNINRRECPILLVFEEAHNYLSANAGGTQSARRTVERIAKEGRKYGVSCMIVSQRPSDISETILSQCNNFVVMRLTNPVDQNYVRRIVADTFPGLENLLPSLRQGEALIVGDAVPMPVRVQIDLPNPEPASADIKFFDKWKLGNASTSVSEVVRRWWYQERC